MRKKLIALVFAIVATLLITTQSYSQPDFLRREVFCEDDGQGCKIPPPP